MIVPLADVTKYDTTIKDVEFLNYFIDVSMASIMRNIDGEYVEIRGSLTDGAYLVEGFEFTRTYLLALIDRYFSSIDGKSLYMVLLNEGVISDKYCRVFKGIDGAKTEILNLPPSERKKASICEVTIRSYYDVHIQCSLQERVTS